MPNILLFTRERFKDSINPLKIIPDAKFYMKDYIDQSLNIDLEYELFVINIRLVS